MRTGWCEHTFAVRCFERLVYRLCRILIVLMALSEKKRCRFDAWNQVRNVERVKLKRKRDYFSFTFSLRLICGEMMEFGRDLFGTHQIDCIFNEELPFIWWNPSSGRLSSVLLSSAEHHFATNHFSSLIIQVSRETGFLMYSRIWFPSLEPYIRGLNRKKKSWGLQLCVPHDSSMCDSKYKLMQRVFTL